jgi:hypothetical protein
VKSWLLFLFLLSSASGRAGNWLTREQVYNFNIGDTFDYQNFQAYGIYGEGMVSCQFPSTFEFSRFVIQSKYYSADSSVLYIVRAQTFPLPQVLDTLVLDSLNYVEVLIDSDCQFVNLIQNSNSQYNGRVTNGLTYCGAGGEGSGQLNFGAGLGNVFSSFFSADPEPGGGFSTDSSSLVYYAKGTEVWGYPYYILNQSGAAHFTPIPEECAVWTNTMDSFYFYQNGLYTVGGIMLQQQIKSGQRIAYGGHAYVEMLASTYYPAQNITTRDSLIGYYRNDTGNACVYLYNQLSNNYFYKYDFTLAAGGDNGTIAFLGYTTVAGQQRTQWNFNNGSGYVEGVGGLTGIWCTDCGIENPNYPCQTLYGSTCFSICGETAFPDGVGWCGFAANNDLAENQMVVKVFPTINDGVVNFEIMSGGIQHLSLRICDLAGNEIGFYHLDSQIGSLDMRYFASGMYIWQLLNSYTILKSGKLIKL